MEDRKEIISKIPIKRYHAIVVGTGAAGYAAADCLYRNGVKNIAVISENVKSGTSRNTGSDKQTYYKLTLCGDQKDSVADMAGTLFAGQCMDGEHALVEAALSTKRFLKLVDLGVPFPTNRYGEYIGYKTDHDPKQRATSIGPYTSKAMTEALEKEVLSNGVPVYDKMQAVELLTENENCFGVICLSLENLEKEVYPYRVFLSNYVIYATGGPAGIYRDSVYPKSQHGASGIAFQAGAKGKNLTEWQYGLASVEPRWNVSGSYMQALPRFISTDQDGHDEKEFLQEYLSEEGILTKIFLKGYEWPFDVRKLKDGSSLIDMAVYMERVKNKRRVFLDYTHNPLQKQLDPRMLSEEAYKYLEKAEALCGTPYERLCALNEPAARFYCSHGIDLKKEMLEIAVCAQHNNGGLAVDLWWQTNIKGLFVIGEAAATHGVYRPGGSALNAGQAGAQRAADYITAQAGTEKMIPFGLIERKLEELIDFRDNIICDQNTVDEVKEQMTGKMSEAASIIRDEEEMEALLKILENRINQFSNYVKIDGNQKLNKAFLVKDMLITQRIYLFSMLDYVKNGGKSRGSAIYCKKEHNDNHHNIFKFCYYEEDCGEKKNIVQEICLKNGQPESNYRPVHPIPAENASFEKLWKQYRENNIIK